MYLTPERFSTICRVELNRCFRVSRNALASSPRIMRPWQETMVIPSATRVYKVRFISSSEHIPGAKRLRSLTPVAGQCKACAGGTPHASGPPLRKSAGAFGAHSGPCWCWVRKLVASSGTSKGKITSGMPRLVHRGTAQARWTEAAGKTREAAVRTTAASQGQKTVTNASVQIVRLSAFLCHRLFHEHTIKKTAGNSSTWL